MKENILILSVIFIFFSCSDNISSSTSLSENSLDSSTFLDIDNEEIQFSVDALNGKISRKSWHYSPGKLLNLLEIKIDDFKIIDIQELLITTEGPYDLEIDGWGTKMTNNKIFSILKSISLKSLDVQDLDDYEDKNYFILEELNTTNIESIALTFNKIDKNQGLEKTLTLLKEKINNSLNLENFKYLSLHIGDYRFTENELKIISEMEIKQFGYSDNEALINTNPVNDNPVYSKSDETVKNILINSPYLEKILYGDYRWFNKKDGEIIYSED